MLRATPSNYAGKIVIVILSPGEADARDLTSVWRYDAVEKSR